MIPGQFEKRCSLCEETYALTVNALGDPLVHFICIPCYNDDPANILGVYGHEKCQNC